MNIEYEKSMEKLVREKDVMRKENQKKEKQIAELLSLEKKIKMS